MAKKPPRNKSGAAAKKEPIAKTRFKQIQKFVNFKYDNKPSTARKIRELHKHLAPAISRPHTVIRSQKKLAAAYRATGAAKGTKGLKAVPVVTDGVKAKIQIKKGRLIRLANNSLTEFIPFNDRAELVYNTVDYVREVLAEYPGGERDVYYPTATGSMFDGGFSKERIPHEISRLFLQYDSAVKWLWGVQYVRLRGQISAREYADRRRKRMRKHFGVEEKTKKKPTRRQRKEIAKTGRARS